MWVQPKFLGGPILFSLKPIRAICFMIKILRSCGMRFFFRIENEVCCVHFFWSRKRG